MRKLLAMLTFAAFHLNSFSQSTENTGWFFLSHKQQLSKKWDGLLDVQLRSADKIKRIQTVLLRGALSYNLNDEHAIATGYAYKGDWEDGIIKKNYQLEHRIYEQYLYNHKLKLTELSVRFRLEQRFLEETEQFHFSQRFRGFISFQIPLLPDKDFSKGLYAGVQNELFVNIQNKENVNNSFYDQNRTYISVGYRWSKKIDTGIGYMYWYQKEKYETAKANVVQLMISTEL